MSPEQEIAKVVFIEGNYAFLKTQNQNACGECASKSSCGSMKLFTPKLDDKYNIRVENTLDLKAGDSVILELPASKLIQGTWLIYLFPLLSLFVCAGLGKLIGGELLSMSAGLGGLFIALFMVKRFVAQKPVAERFVPKVSRKVLLVDTI